MTRHLSMLARAAAAAAALSALPAPAHARCDVALRIVAPPGSSVPLGSPVKWLLHAVNLSAVSRCSAARVGLERKGPVPAAVLPTIVAWAELPSLAPKAEAKLALVEPAVSLAGQYGYRIVVTGLADDADATNHAPDRTISRTATLSP